MAAWVPDDLVEPLEKLEGFICLIPVDSFLLQCDQTVLDGSEMRNHILLKNMGLWVNG